MLIPYLHIAYNIAFFVAGWIFGDWKNWRRYYSTIIFFIAGDLIQNFTTSFVNYPLWRYHGTIPPNHLLINLLINFMAYPATVLIYLKYALRGWKPFIFHFLLWVFLYSIIEYINLPLGLISHYNGLELGFNKSDPVFNSKGLLCLSANRLVVVLYENDCHYCGLGNPCVQKIK